MRRRFATSTAWRVLAGAAAALAVTACVDSGLPGKNLPLETAEHLPPPYPLYERAPADEPLAAGIAVAGRAWTGVEAAGAPWGLLRTRDLPAPILRDVGAVDGASVYALAWDSAPFDRLYARLPSGAWRVFLPLR